MQKGRIVKVSCAWRVYCIRTLGPERRTKLLSDRRILQIFSYTAKKYSVFLFHSCTVHLDTIKVFIYQLMRNRVALKEY